MMQRDLLDRVRKVLGDRYTVITSVGRGGNASIFGAHDKSGRQVAIKVLHPELAVSVAADRFLREINYARALDHPRIVPVVDCGESDYLLWFVMPYVPGDSLRQVLRRDAQLAVPRAARIGCEVLEALGYAHDQGLAHRDIKPDNIVCSSAGAVLVDFGIARAITTSGEDRVTRSGFVVGTEEYMSPEQAAADHDIDGRTDPYPPGPVQLQALAGRHTFSSSSAAARMDMRHHQPPPDRRPWRREGPKGLAAASGKSLAKPRTERWPTAAAMRDARGPL